MRILKFIGVWAGIVSAIGAGYSTNGWAFMALFIGWMVYYLSSFIWDMVK